ncbi:MAG: PIN domain-containing protein [Bacteroidales bacterium]|nr:PIN domain-containing protein [Bacteroidales bacterium]
MKAIFLDTNVFIDYLAQRKDFYEPAVQVIEFCTKKKIKVLVSALSFATASYVMSAHNKMAHTEIKNLFSDFVKHGIITPVDSKTINESLKSEFIDFEDAMQYYSALRENADIIITRNKNDFAASKIPVFTPQEFLEGVEED